MKSIIKKFLILISFYSVVFGAPYHSITIDGDLSDWFSDELKVPDYNDSDFDPGKGLNEIQAIYCSWDEFNFYVGIEGRVSDNGWIVFFDKNFGLTEEGFQNLENIDTWNRVTRFFPLSSTTFYCDFFYAAWSGSNGNFYQLKSSYSPTDISGQVSLSASTSSFKPGAEIKIPFSVLYQIAGNRVQPNSKIALVATIVSGDYETLKRPDAKQINRGRMIADSAPNNISKKLWNQATSTSTEYGIDNYLVIEIDNDSNSVPDSLISLQKPQIKNFSLSPNPFSPDNSGINDYLTIEFTVDQPSTLTINIFDIAGRMVSEFVKETLNFSESQKKFTYIWNGKDFNNNNLPIGVYIISTEVSNSNGTTRVNKPCVILR